MAADWASGSLVAMAQASPWPARLALPVAGGVDAGALIVIARRRTPGGGSEYMEAIAIGGGRLRSGTICCAARGRWRRSPPAARSDAKGRWCSLASLGASLIGRVTHLDTARLQLLTACGVAAGISAAYNAPLAGAFFVSDIVLGSIAMTSFGPLVVPSVVANIAMRAFPGYDPSYEMPVFRSITGASIRLRRSRVVCRTPGTSFSAHARCRQARVLPHQMIATGPGWAQVDSWSA